MIDTLVHKYTVKRTKIRRSVIFFKFKEAVSSDNIKDIIQELLEIKAQHHDCYVAILNHEKFLSGRMIKILLALRNSFLDRFGVIPGPNIKEHLIIKKLKRYINIENTAKTLIIRMETKKLEFNRNVRS